MSIVMKIVRSIAAVVVGLIAAMLTISGMHKISLYFYPWPEGFDPNDMQQFRELLRTMPTGAFLMVLLSWESGAFVGGLASALIAGWARCVHAWIIGVLVLAATIANCIMLKGHPDWLIIAGLLLPMPASLVAGKIVALLLSPATSPSPPAESKAERPVPDGAVRAGESPFRSNQ